MRVCERVCVCVRVRVRVHVCVHMSVCARVCVYVCASAPMGATLLNRRMDLALGQDIRNGRSINL
jgi:hypothetical protein